MSFWLEYLENGQKREFTFNSSQISVGRDQAADFVLDHPPVSRQHAIIVAEPHGAKLVVLSRGGLTALNGQQVAGEVQLMDGNQIHFGQLAFTFRSHQVQQHQAADGWTPAADAWSEGAAFDKPGDRVGRKRAEEVVPPPVAQNFPNPETGGIKSWDEIAAGADEQEDMDHGASNFQRLQEASKKANKASSGTNPVLLIGGGLLAAAMLAYSFWPADPVAVGVVGTSEEAPEINWQQNDIK